MTQLELQIIMDDIVDKLRVAGYTLEWIEEALHDEINRIVEEIEDGYWE